MRTTKEVYTCDQCGGELEVGLDPGDISNPRLVNWYRAGSYGKKLEQFCSVTCLATWAANEFNVKRPVRD